MFQLSVALIHFPFSRFFFLDAMAVDSSIFRIASGPDFGDSFKLVVMDPSLVLPSFNQIVKGHKVVSASQAYIV